MFQQIKVISRIPRMIFKKYKAQISTLIILGFVGGLLESIGISALIPLFSFVTKTDMAQNRISWILEGLFSFIGVSLTLWTLLLFMAAVFFMKAVISLGFGYIRTKIIVDYETATQRAVYEGMLFATWPHLLKEKIGHLENVLTVDILGASGLLKQISALILEGSNFLVYSIIAFAISGSITGMAFVFGMLFLVASRPFFVRTKRYAAERLALNKKISHQVNESILGLKTIKAMRIEKDIARTGWDFFEQIQKIKMGQYLAQNSLPILMEPLSFLFVIGVFALSYTRSTFSIAAFVAVIYLVQRIFSGVNNIQRAFGAMIDTIPYVQRLLQVQEDAEKNKERDLGTLPFVFAKELAFDRVGFEYVSGKGVLSDVSFSVGKGEMVGIIGASGAGKTTIVDLLLRLFRPQRGRIAVDGKDVNDIRIREWRRNIGYVSQDLFLKNDTIENNIRFYDPDITDDDIMRAARSAYCFGFVSKLPQGFKTIIGDRGVMLSNGQRQRIVLARILARRPNILILDEATSALDTESEQYIQKSIQELHGEVTIIVIAHRLSTVMGVDRLIVLEGGTIKEQGVPSALLKNTNSYFYKAYHAA